MATAAQVRKMPPHFTKPLANGVEVFGKSTFTEKGGWETSLAAVKGSKVVGTYETATWSVKAAGRVVKPAEGQTEYDAWLAALRGL